MRILSFTLVLLSLAGCAEVESLTRSVLDDTSTTGAIPDVPRDDWDTTYGVMALSALQEGRVTAYYEGENGTLDGTLRGRRYTGIWVEPSSAQSCATTRRGSNHWGQFEFTFNPAFDRFEGVWSYCEAAPTRSWSGTKQ